MNPMEFFKGHSRYQVESRDERGLERPAEGTNIAMMLKAAKAHMLRTVPAITLALLTVTGAPATQAGPVNPYALADIVKVAEQGQRDLIPLLNMMDPAYFSSVGMVKIHESLKNEKGGGTPSATATLDFSTGKTSCEINMVGMSHIYEVINKNLDSPIDLTTANDVRGMVAAHEIAHCEFYFGLTAVTKSEPGIKAMAVQPFYQSWLFLNDIEHDLPGLKQLQKELMVTMMERQADAKMLLLVASANLDPSDTTEAIRDGLANFDRHVGLLAKLREHDESSVMGYNDHDTKSVVNAVVRLVHEATTSPKKMLQLKEITSSPSKMNDYSVQLTIGSMLDQMPQIMTAILNDQINEQKGLIKKSKNNAEKASAEILVKKSMEEFKNISQYDFSSRSDTHSVDLKFIENSRKTWNSLKANSNDHSFSSRECKHEKAADYARPRSAC